MKKLYIILCIIVITILLPKDIMAQVTIGSGSSPKDYSILELSTEDLKGGLRLPHLTTTERDQLTSDVFKADVSSVGLTIYNVTANCIEYWNGSRWISICSGNANISFNGSNLLDLTFPSEGGVKGGFVPTETPACTGQEPYTFSVITGADFTSVNIINQSTSEFTITMSPNNTARQRTAIVRITNNCTGEYQEFIFSQLGELSLCEVAQATKPVITIAGGSSALCQGGAVYMSVAPVNGLTYIWTLNEVAQGSGSSYTATAAGVYKVYVNAVGCETVNANNVSDAVTVTSSSTAAPSSRNLNLLATNNAIVCGSNPVSLWALNVPSEGTLVWFKNGVEQTALAGNNPVSVTSATIGDWHAAIKDGACYSFPSQSVTITESIGSSLATPEITVNGSALASVSSFCISGSLTLALSNAASYGAVTVQWFNGLTFLGEGFSITTTAPSTGVFLLRCIITDNSSQLCAVEVATNKTLTGTAPARPNIISSPALICGGSPAILTASSSGSSYRWYLDGALQAGYTTQTISAASTGSYQVEVLDAACVSPMSTPVSVGLSDFPSLAWVSSPVGAEPNTVATYQVSGTFSPANYTWTASNGAIITNGNGTNTVTVRFPDSETTVVLTVTATNACGISNALIQNVLVEKGCTPPVIRNTTMNPTGTMLSGTTLTMSVTADGTAPLSYQWRLNGVNIAGAPNAATYTINNALLSHAGTYSCVVTGCEGNTATATVGTISILNAAIPVGSGVFSGETCFDVALSNDNANGCGALASRQTMRADFTQTSTNTQTYTFTPSGTVSNVRFLYINTNGSVIASITPNGAYTGNSITTACTATVVYNNNLNTLARGLSSDQALTADIYVVYNSNANNTGTDMMLKLTSSVKDCACCGVNIGAGQWKRMMCHNLGANESADPFTPSVQIVGDYYNYGNKRPRRFGPAQGDIANPEGTGTFTAWSDNTKVATDPCPDGYRVPTRSQWTAIMSNNAITRTGTWTSSASNFSTGAKVGSSLFLPAGGMFTTGSSTITSRGSNGYYWSSTNNPGYNNAGYLNIVSTGTPSAAINTAYGNAISVRCIAQ